jgi:hypothetical protein
VEYRPRYNWFTSNVFGLRLREDRPGETLDCREGQGGGPNVRIRRVLQHASGGTQGWEPLHPNCQRVRTRRTQPVSSIIGTLAEWTANRAWSRMSASGKPFVAQAEAESNSRCRMAAAERASSYSTRRSGGVRSIGHEEPTEAPLCRVSVVQRVNASDGIEAG